jgi:hypothetical protein
VSDRRSGREVDSDSSLLHVLVVNLVLHVGVVALFTSGLRVFSKDGVVYEGQARYWRGFVCMLALLCFGRKAKAEGDAECIDAKIWRRWMNVVVG